MKIRKIIKDDLKICSEILERAYSRDPYNEAFNKNTALEYINNKYKNFRENSFVVINEEYEVVAFIFLNISSWSDGFQAVLEEIVVDPSFQGSGIGRDLMLYAHNYLDSLGVRSSMLWVKNDERLLKFYKKQGYFPADDFVVMFKNF